MPENNNLRLVPPVDTGIDSGVGINSQESGAEQVVDPELSSVRHGMRQRLSGLFAEVRLIVGIACAPAVFSLAFLPKVVQDRVYRVFRK